MNTVYNTHSLKKHPTVLLCSHAETLIINKNAFKICPIYSTGTYLSAEMELTNLKNPRHIVPLCASCLIHEQIGK